MSHWGSLLVHSTTASYVVTLSVDPLRFIVVALDIVLNPLEDISYIISLFYESKQGNILQNCLRDLVKYKNATVSTMNVMVWLFCLRKEAGMCCNPPPPPHKKKKKKETKMIKKP